MIMQSNHSVVYSTTSLYKDCICPYKTYYSKVYVCIIACVVIMCIFHVGNNSVFTYTQFFSTQRTHRALVEG